jgi:hypothetical protein
VERSSRVGSHWDTDIQPIFSRSGNFYTKEQYYRRFGNSTLGRGESTATCFIPRKHCDLPLEIDSRGFAYCQNPKCSKVFNFGNPQDKDKPTMELKIKEWGPPMQKRSRKRGSAVAPQVAAP